MAEYIDRENIIPHAIDDDYEEGGERLIVEYEDIKEMPTADVIERSEYNRALELIAYLFGEHDKREAEYTDLHSKINKAKSDIKIMLEAEKQKDGTYTDVGQGIAIALGLLNNEIGE